jgi:hypothetical protein
MGEEPTRTSGIDERIRRAYADGVAAAIRGDEAAPGCTTSAEGRAFLRGYIDGAQTRVTAKARPMEGSP